MVTISLARNRVPSIPKKILEPRHATLFQAPLPSTKPNLSQGESAISPSVNTVPSTNTHPGIKFPKGSVLLAPTRATKKRQQPSTPTHLAPSPNKRVNTPVTSTRKLLNDRLGTLVRELSASYENASSWEALVASFRGPSYLSPELELVDHPAIELLRQWRDQGVPAESTSENWTRKELDRCIERGCHLSANEHRDFLREEMAEFIENRFWMVLPYAQARNLPNLMLSPAAVKEERDRKPRLLCDHSWNPVNETTIEHAPPEAMQFGGALPRILKQVRHANRRFGPVHLAKHDIKDGFYRLFLRARDCPRLAIILPTYPGEEPLVAVPMACTMGWTQSPPTFSTMSETVADIANREFLASPRRAKPHRLEHLAADMDDVGNTNPNDRGDDDDLAAARLAKVTGRDRNQPEPGDSSRAPPSNKSFQRPLGETDVFVDDFIQLGQGGKLRLNTLRRHLLHAIDKILATPESTDTRRNEAVSLKKLVQGDGSWKTRKLILGWIIDTIRETIELPAHRKDTLAEIFEELALAKRVSAKRWSSILGKLRFVSMAIPGSAALFSALQLASKRAGKNRVRIDSAVRSSLDGFCRLAASLCERPTHLAEVVPQDPSLLGATDAAKPGMGGIFFDATGQGYLWRHPFPLEVQSRLVSADNRGGDITNSDLEQAGVLGQLDVMASTLEVQYATIENSSDNTPAVSRFSKGAVSSLGAAARLCCLASDHQRLHRYCHLTSYLPGPANSMADDASRLQHLSDHDFLSHFEQQYPQNLPWQLCHLRPVFSSTLISTLLRNSPLRPKLPRQTELKKRSGASGQATASPSASILSFMKSPTLKSNSPTSSSSPIATDWVDKPTSLSGLVQWRKPYWRWARGSPTWPSKISASRLEEISSIPYSLLSSKGSTTRMIQPPEPILPTSPSFEGSTRPSTSNTPRLA